MKDFLLFNTFITPNILILFYYIGAIIAPLFLWLYKEKITDQKIYQKNKYAFILFMSIFFFMELFWRMFFEMLIGYFDIHNYLHIMVENLK